MSDDAQDWDHQQRRLRHVSDILVRNLSLDGPVYRGSWSASASTSTSSKQPSFVKHGSIDNNAGQAEASTSGSGGARSRAIRPSLTQRTSRDDIDIHRSTLQHKIRRGSLRRKRTVSGEGAQVPAAGQASATTAPSQASVKGKERARDQNIEAAVEGLPKGDGSDAQDSDVVFGWMSTRITPPALARSSSRGSVKSESSYRRSGISSVSKRLFRTSSVRKAHAINSDDEDTSQRLQEEEDGDEVDSDDPRGAAYQARRDMERSFEDVMPMPTSPLPHPHVTFDFTSAQTPSNILNRSRNRSASRSSAFSIASGSSGSTIRQLPSLRYNYEQRNRQKRSEARQNQLVRTKLTISLMHTSSEESAASSATKSTPAFLRNRTLSLPLTTSIPNGKTSTLHDATFASPSSTSGPPKCSQPILVSKTHHKSMEPSFTIDSADILLPPHLRQIVMREQNLVIGIWVDQPMKEKQPQWKLLFEWQVDLSALTSLGSDPSLFPQHLPPNTLMFKLTDSSEYWTARLPDFISPEAVDEEDELSDGDIRETVSDPEDLAAGLDADAVGGRHRRIKMRPAGKATNLSLDKRERDRRIARRQMIMEKSMRETKMMKSVDDGTLAFLIQREKEMNMSRETNRHIERSIQECLAEGGLFDLERRRNEQDLTTTCRRQDFEESTASIKQMQKDRDAKRDALKKRRQRLKDARASLEKQNQGLVKSHVEHKLDLDVCESMRLSFAQRRAFLISELAIFFPIEPVDAASLLFSICDIPLPNSNFESTRHMASMYKYDEEHIASALGFAAQVVHVLAAYLAIPLHYPIKCIGSRSVVQDPISQMKGPKIFPLYAKGVDKYRFEYAVFLLNKNIEQLMLEYHIIVLDLRQTLPNLKNLYLTLSTDVTSHRTYASNPNAPDKSDARSKKSAQSAIRPVLVPLKAQSSSESAKMDIKPLTSRKSHNLNGSSAMLEKLLEAPVIAEANGHSHG